MEAGAGALSALLPTCSVCTSPRGLIFLQTFETKSQVMLTRKEKTPLRHTDAHHMFNITLAVVEIALVPIIKAIEK